MCCIQSRAKKIQNKIALHYPEGERESVWERVQLKYAEFLSEWRTDLGGKKNFHNGTGGTYDYLHARLVRTTTCADGCKCDYAICGDRDDYIKEHPEYRDEAGYRKNK